MSLKDEIISIRKLPINFFEPIIDDVGEIKLLRNIDKAKSILLKNINNNSKITIFSDIDIDGIMATTIMYNWLEKTYHDNKKIIYQQRNKGHGIKADIVKKTDLLIIVDSSSNDYYELHDIIKNSLAKEIIIIDHHEVFTVTNGKITEPEIFDIPNLTLLNPHQPKCKFKNKDISGALLTYRFLEYVSEDDEIYKRAINQLSDLAAISIISDVMRVDNMENRYYYYRGTSSIQNNGLFNFMNKNRINAFNVNSDKFAFEINPKLNATIRMSSMKSVLLLFLQNDNSFDERRGLVEKIEQFYKKKGEIEQNILDKMTILYSSENMIIYQNCYNDENNLSKNFNGIIASKKAEENQAHILVVDENLKGSGRSFGNYNFKDYLSQFTDLINCIGHQGAFGVKINNIDKLKEQLDKTQPIVNKILSKDYEIEIEFKKLSKDFFEEVDEVQFMVGNGYKDISFKINNININTIKSTTGGTTYYIDDRKNYIRILNKTNMEFDLLDEINVYGNIYIKQYFGKNYYEIHCYNIEQIN